ncbi:MAG: glycosyltransferase family 39 protein [Dehalococcoidia bacterium]
MRVPLLRGANLNTLFADRDDVIRAAALAVLGLASALIYLLLTVRMSFIEFFPGPGITLDFVKMLGPDWQENTALLLTSFAGLFVLYGLALVTLGRGHGPLSLAALGLSALAFALVLTFMYPPQAVDFIHNVADARTLWVHGDNAMVVPPNAHPFPVGQSYGHESAPYGPLWFLLLFPVLLAGDSIQFALHILKFYTSLYYLGSAILIFLLARQLTPGRELFAAALYAWNPFVVLRVAGNGHNDVVMFFFVLLALWALVNERWRYLIPLLVASALIKYVSLMLIPPVVLAGFLMAGNRRLFLRETAVGLGLALVLAVACFAFFWEGADTFEIVRRQGDKFITSTPLVLREQLRVRTEISDVTSDSVARWAGIAAFDACYAALLLSLWRSKAGAIPLIACLSLMMLTFSFFGVTWYRPWYMLWPLTLLPLVPGRWAVGLIVAISMGGMLPDLIEQYRHNLDFFREHYLWSVAAPVIVAFVPAALVLLAGWARTRHSLLSDDGAGVPLAQPSP